MVGNSNKTTQTQLLGMYTLIAVYVQFYRFIDLTINSHTNPYWLPDLPVGCCDPGIPVLVPHLANFDQS